MTEVVKKAPQIIRGRIALAIVYLIRFVEAAETGTKALAEKYGTTVGKVDDIRKNRNFAYVTEDVRFTQEQIQEGINFIAQHEDTDSAVVVTDMLNALEVATPEQAEAFAGTRRKAGAQPRTDAEGNVIEAGGGNRQPKSKKQLAKEAKEAAETEAEKGEGQEGVEPEPTTEPTSDELLGDI